MVLSGVPRKKFPMTPPGIDPGTVWLVAQRLNHYATPGPLILKWLLKKNGRSVDFINLAQGRQRLNGFVNTAMNVMPFWARWEHTEITGVTLLRWIGHGSATAEFRTPSLHPLHRHWCRDSVVGTATLRDWRSEDRIPVGAKFSSLVRTDPGPHPTSCTMGTASLAREGEVKWPERGVDQPFSFSADVKEYSYTSTAPLDLHGLL